jgi:hypothetical protein
MSLHRRRALFEASYSALLLRSRSDQPTPQPVPGGTESPQPSKSNADQNFSPGTQPSR